MSQGVKKAFLSGNEAFAEGSRLARPQVISAYPITPQTEVGEYLSSRMPELGRRFLQAENEMSAIYMIFGAYACGMRSMTSSSGPGFSLKQEGIAYLCANNFPSVLVNVQRWGPGLGTLDSSQTDYLRDTRGGGNGDYRTVVLAPANIQEAVDLTQEAFDIADQYRNPVVLLADGLIGQMMEPIVWKERTPRTLPEKTWAACGRGDRDHNNFITSLLIDAPSCEAHNLELHKKVLEMEKNECRWEEILLDDAEMVLVAYGTPSRVAQTAAENLRRQGIKAGVFRPVTLWPYPYARLREIADLDRVKGFLTVEMSLGQMLDDVNLAVAERKPVKFYGRCGGKIPGVSEVERAALEAWKEVK